MGSRVEEIKDEEWQGREEDGREKERERKGEERREEEKKMPLQEVGVTRAAPAISIHHGSSSSTAAPSRLRLQCVLVKEGR
ncbi:hypothetical protein E2C01_097686 [Portunus trituberculatus]|uniref:Uncharacterized protein n=1 Tax=Portunus trituberculatus TaxID=210409 RepID=A0A5B7K6C3_PORTR|nr:hypothetical protein [Portunus trituberculatus]